MSFITKLKRPELFRLAEALEVVPQHGGRIRKYELENAIHRWSYERGILMKQHHMHSQIFPSGEFNQEAMGNPKIIGDRN
jgi:hypothetical protein